VPLTLAAALGALAFGHVELSVTTSIIIGSVPAVLVGAFLSSRAPDRYIRPAITFVIFASGLKYVGVGTTALGWILCATLLAAGSAGSPWRARGGAPTRTPTSPVPTDPLCPGILPSHTVSRRSTAGRYVEIAPHESPAPSGKGPRRQPASGVFRPGCGR
jgi:hypothetical protein